MANKEGKTNKILRMSDKIDKDLIDTYGTAYFIKNRRKNCNRVEVYDLVSLTGKVVSITKEDLLKLSKTNLVIGVYEDKIVDKTREAKKLAEKIYLQLEILKCAEVNFFCYRNGPIKDPKHILTCMSYVSNEGKENKFTLKFISKLDNIDELHKIYAHITQRFSSDYLISNNIDDICSYIMNHLYDLKNLSN